MIENSINLVSLQSSIGVEMRLIAQTDRNTIVLKWVEKWVVPPKIQKIDFLSPKMAKMTKKSKNFILNHNFFGWGAYGPGKDQGTIVSFNKNSTPCSSKINPSDGEAITRINT